MIVDHKTGFQTMGGVGRWRWLSCIVLRSLGRQRMGLGTGRIMCSCILCVFCIVLGVVLGVPFR